jgi:hypothetical protein
MSECCLKRANICQLYHERVLFKGNICQLYHERVLFKEKGIFVSYIMSECCLKRSEYLSAIS